MFRFVTLSQPSRPIDNLFQLALPDSFSAEKPILSQATMRCCAGPWILFSLSNHPCSHRITLSIANGGPEIGLIKWRGEISPLPNMTFPALLSIKSLGISHMQWLEHCLKPILCLRNQKTKRVASPFRGTKKARDSRRPASALCGLRPPAISRRRGAAE